MEEIRWGIIGCGDVTEVKSGPALNLVPHSRLVAVMRRNTEKARDYAARHGVPHWFDDATALIRHPEVNAIYIATPPDTHARYAMEALEAGKPVYVEKPMARNFQECKEMLDAAARTGKDLLVAYYRRCLPAFLQIEAWLKAGAIGEVRMVNIRLFHPPHEADMNVESLPWRVLPEISGGGHFMDLAAHQLDLLDYLLGPVAEAQGIAANQQGYYPAEDAVAGVFRFESGVLGTGSWNFGAEASQREDLIEIIGSEGKISFSCFQADPSVLETRQGKTVAEIIHPRHIQQPLIEKAVAHLLGKGVCPSTGESAARTNRVMDAMLATYYDEPSRINTF